MVKDFQFRKKGLKVEEILKSRECRLSIVFDCHIQGEWDNISGQNTN